MLTHAKPGTKAVLSKLGLERCPGTEALGQAGSHSGSPWLTHAEPGTKAVLGKLGLGKVSWDGSS
jgi:hypothetical protein